MGSQGNISGVAASKLVASSSGPNIVKDGLTVLLDSRSPRSYPGSGNTWFDLSGNNNHASLNNFTGPGASTTSGYNSTTRFMMFDRHVGTSNTAVNNVAVIPSSDTTEECTILGTPGGFSTMFWFRQDQYRCTALAKMNNCWEVYYCSNLVFRTQGTGGNDYNTGISQSVNAFFFQFVAVTHTGNERKVYLNRLDQDIYRLNTPLENSNTVTSQSPSSIGVGAYSNGYYSCQGALPYYMLYNRPLSEDEIRQNFNATKRGFVEIKFC